MTFRSIISVLTILSFGANSAVSGQVILQFDTSKIAIIQPDRKMNKIQWPFDSTYKPAVLTQIELHIIEQVLVECITNYNRALKPEYKYQTIDLSKRNYRTQLAVVSNTKGEKEVWVNCLCNVFDFDWKHDIHTVYDGGSCFFELKINLTLKKYYNLWVNGVA